MGCLVCLLKGFEAEVELCYAVLSRAPETCDHNFDLHGGDGSSAVVTDDLCMKSRI